MPAAPAPVAPTHAVLTVTAHVPAFEPEPASLPELQTLPAFEVVGGDPIDPSLPEPTEPAILPDPTPYTPLVAAPWPSLRVTTRMFQRPMPKRTVAAEPAPPVAQPVSVPVKAAVKPAPVPARAAVKPTPRGRDLRPQSVPPLLRYYPRELRARGVEGRVMVKVTVNARGYVVDAEVLTSSGRGAFDKAALRLVRDTRFVPLGGVAYAKLPVTFRIP